MGELRKGFELVISLVLLCEAEFEVEWEVGIDWDVGMVQKNLAALKEEKGEQAEKPE